MNFFVLMVDDRHAGPDVRVFSSSESAITNAKKIAHSLSRGGKVEEILNDAMKKAGWLYYATYSGDGDNVKVLERVIED